MVLIITDDQSYGDLRLTGSPIAKTPHVDRRTAERKALLIGHWTNRTSVWHTVNGR